ncbi:hypothetical protein DPX16_17717 [Anabarilius grahami]|uniref:Uncharacterized protein n=1 Tax=Anabarilius grahami TaxID=495550 RepID=A0A3N0YIA8_ANAGA|nr:hypothetical protein DPX16_17717 [Anabarilius grahami]
MANANAPAVAVHSSVALSASFLPAQLHLSSAPLLTVAVCFSLSYNIKNARLYREREENMSKEGEERNSEGVREKMPLSEIRAVVAVRPKERLSRGVPGDDLKTRLFISRFQSTLPTGAIRDGERDT